MAFLGFVVKEKSEQHPKGTAVSKYFAGHSSAQDALAIYETAAKKEGRKATFWVEEVSRKEKE